MRPPTGFLMFPNWYWDFFEKIVPRPPLGNFSQIFPFFFMMAPLMLSCSCAGVLQQNEHWNFYCCNIFLWTINIQVQQFWWYWYPWTDMEYPLSSTSLSLQWFLLFVGFGPPLTHCRSGSCTERKPPLR